MILDKINPRTEEKLFRYLGAFFTICICALLLYLAFMFGRVYEVKNWERTQKVENTPGIDRGWYLREYEKKVRS